MLLAVSGRNPLGKDSVLVDTADAFLNRVSALSVDAPLPTLLERVARECDFDEYTLSSTHELHAECTVLRLLGLDDSLPPTLRRFTERVWRTVLYPEFLAAAAAIPPKKPAASNATPSNDLAVAQ